MWIVYEPGIPGPHQVGSYGVFVAGQPRRVAEEVAERLLALPGFRPATAEETPADSRPTPPIPIGKMARAEVAAKTRARRARNKEE